MLHLQKHFVLFSRHQWLLPLSRFSSTAASPGSAPFAVADYLVASCHLTREQALRASQKLSHLKSPSNPDAVRAILSDFGLTPHDIAAAVVRRPKLLCCKADKTLAPCLAALKEHGLSTSQIARFVVLDPIGSLKPAIISKLKYYVPLFGSVDHLLRSLKHARNFLGADLERVVKPNVKHLCEFVIGEQDISRICRRTPNLLCGRSGHLQEMVVRAEEMMGVPRNSRMFIYALRCVATRNKEYIAAKMEFFRKTFGWSEAQLRFAVSRDPWVLTVSNDKALCVSKFLMSVVGLDPEYIARRPALLKYGLESRHIPRRCVMKFLKENGLLKHDWGYYSAVQLNEKAFMEKFICPFKEAAPHLADDYAAACRGEVPL